MLEQIFIKGFINRYPANQALSLLAEFRAF
jgi:hypothetical protein